MACLCDFLRNLGQRDVTDDGREDESIPEVYRERFRSLPAGSQVPPLLVAAVAREGSAALEPSRTLCRRKPPNSFLHSTLSAQGALGAATYYFQIDEAGVVVAVFAHWHVTARLEGPPNFCHGGCVASLMDDAFGAFTNTHLRSSGKSGAAVTAYLHVDYKKPTPLSAGAVCAVMLDKIENRKVFSKGELLCQAPTGEWVVTCEANALFVQVKP